MGGLADQLRRTIAHHGPITVAAYMETVLAHPRHGVYASRDPFGAEGDFITAPEISQMFGELIGLWCAVVWRAMGGPDPVALVELGPGRGTLIADALRAARGQAPFLGAARLHLVETSRRLRDRQREALAATDLAHPPAWHDTLDDVPDDAMLVVANEFFDALPVRQFQQTPQGWRERLIDIDPDGGFGFTLAPSAAAQALVPASLGSSPPGSVFEVSPSAIAIAHALGRRLARRGGAALIIDYGHTDSAAGDTLQAVRRHRFHDALDAPGTADVTAHVDFAALGRAAGEGGAAVHGPVPQGVFLESLGIGARATALRAGATPEQAREVAAARRRLVDPAEMGTLFKVMAVTAPAAPPPPGFA
ncbi:MAG: SAM-dependent methyltransferase [Rhodospirillales bacterium]|jgi:NADH dehydrogenase [ubiquinone] 1 alpha subcomplex assembly factor 7|nr:SAM-dependent methyltransferase [Rhodospirillales bacterium]MDP6884276.1 SAM-dependent methyltransferase [Rhodospirillales bacterium]